MKLEMKARKHFGSKSAKFRDEIKFEAKITRHATDTNEEIAVFRQAVAAIQDALRDEGLRIFFRPETVHDDQIEGRTFHTPEAIAQFAKAQREIDLLKADKPVEGPSLNAILANPPIAAYKPPTEAQYRALVARLNVAEAQAKAFKAKSEKLMFEKLHGESL